jgi:hypothetical protein
MVTISWRGPASGRIHLAGRCIRGLQGGNGWPIRRLAPDNEIWTTSAGRGAMPRPERPVDASQGPVPRFAADLRRLRAGAGDITYRELAREAHFSKATLSAAAAGHRLPTWDVTHAYVQGCGGDIAEWRARWQATRAELGFPAEPPAQDYQAALLAEEVTGAIQGGLMAGGRRPMLIAAGVVLAAGAAAALMWSVGHAHTTMSGTSGRARFSAEPAARFAGSPEPIADNNDPEKTGCAYDPAVTTLDSVDIDTAAENLLGVAELRYSPRCQVAWGRFVPSNRMAYFKNAVIIITATRPGTYTAGTSYRTRFDGQDVFGNILTTRQSCVEITVTVRAPTGGGTETTHCER